MWAMVVTADLPEDLETADGAAALDAEVVPRVKMAPGFQHGLWMRHDEKKTLGYGIVVFDTEANARDAAAMAEVGGPAGGPGTRIAAVDIYEVATQA